MTYVDIAGIVKAWWDEHQGQPDNSECEECDAFESEPCGQCWECEHADCGSECEDCEGRGGHCSELTWEFPVESVAKGVAPGLAIAVDGDLMDMGFTSDDVDEASVREFARELADFWHAMSEDLKGLDAAGVGQDFMLTRNGHGAGFWDRGLGERGDRLTDMARPYGTFGLLVYPDGKLHSHG